MAAIGDNLVDGVLTPLELQIMQVLWNFGTCSVGDVRAKLEADLAYTTVQTMLNILLKKGKVTRAAVGRAFTYTAVVTREGTARYTLRDIITRMFGGSAQALLMTLVDARELTSEQIDQASEVLRASKADGSEP